VHPEALLAGYVDGSAGERDRETVEAHLARCARCREDVAAAARGLEAARSLGPVDAPGLAAAITDAVTTEADLSSLSDRRAGSTRPGRSARADRPRWSRVTTRVAAAGGLAAVAAGTVALLVLVVGGHGSNLTGTGPRPAAAGRVKVVDRGHSYTTSDLVALAGRLATRYSGEAPLSAAARPAPSPSDTGFQAASPANVPAGPAGQEATCLVRGGAPTSTPVYLEVATVDGKSAFVGAYLLSEGSGGPNHLALVAVARSSCQPIFLTSRKV